jgi:hypothetical protein
MFYQRILVQHFFASCYVAEPKKKKTFVLFSCLINKHFRIAIFNRCCSLWKISQTHVSGPAEIHKTKHKCNPAILRKHLSFAHSANLHEKCAMTIVGRKLAA